MWSFVGSKDNQRWLWLAIDHVTRAVVAFVFEKRTDEVFLKLKALLDPLNPRKYYSSDNWGAYERNLDADKHVVGKQNTRRIERKNLNARTRIKRLVRKTICFSKTVTELYINRQEFGIAA
ncbi:IS1 family transposase [Breznakiellaceae bacterium SP9]